MFWPPRMMSSLSRPVIVRNPFASLRARDRRCDTSPSRSAFAVSSRLVVIAGHDVGAAHDQFAFLAGPTSRPLRSTMRTASPGSGMPHEPMTRPPVGQFIVTMVEVSVMP